MKTAPKLIAAAGLLFLFSAASLAREKVQSLAQIYPQESSQTQSDTTVRQKVEGREYVAMQREDVATGRDFRTPGYKGSVSVTNMGLLTLGIETSHGYMFDRSNYLGLAAGAYSFGGRHFDLGGLFLDYTHYMRDAQNSFRIGAKLGALFDFASLLAYGATTHALPLVEPNIGWNWVLRNGTGISATVGAVIARNDTQTEIAPKFTLSFEF